MASRQNSPERGHPRERTTYLAFAALGVLALIWGYNWVVMKTGIEHSEPFTFAALRVFLGAIVLFPFLALLRRPLRPPAPIFTIVLGILQTTGFVGLMMWALESGSTSRTTILTYTMPFWVLLMAWPILHEKIRGLQWVAVGLALLGLVLILRPWHFTGSLSSSMMAVGAGFSWALSVVLVKVMQQRHHVDLLSFTAWQMLIGAVPICLIAVFTYEAPDWSGVFVASLTFNVIPGGAIAWLLWLYAVSRLPAGIVSISSLVIPVVGVLSAAIQLGERPALLETIGMLVVLGGIAVLTARGIALSRGRRRSGRSRHDNAPRSPHA
jgi:drug/metabolite transporter (DMT)-like permease